MNVSAIVSAYYAETFLQQRLENLLAQVPQPEVIVIAKRGSKEEEIVKRFPVTWILTDDIPTIYTAWNIGILASNCDYITNANCDDLTYMGAYKEMSDILDEFPDVALVYGDNDVTENNGFGVAYLKRRPGGDYNELKRRCFVGPFPMWRKSLHTKYGFFNEHYKVCGDYEFWLRIASHNENIAHLGKSVGMYMLRPDSAEHRNHDLAESEKREIQKLYRDIVIK